MAALGLAAPPEEKVQKPKGPEGPPTAWIVVGPRTRQQMATVLEPQLAAVWVALLETSGVPPEQPYRLVVEAAHLEPATE